MNYQINECFIFVDLPEGRGLKVGDYINLKGENHESKNIFGLYQIDYISPGKINLTRYSNHNDRFQTFYILSQTTQAA